jgi:transposase-like protein
MNEIKIKEFISTLSSEQKSTLLTILREKRISEYKTLLSEIFTDNKSVTDIKEERFSNGLFCTKCGCTTNIVKAGRGVNNKQRYLCKNCSKIFTSTTDTFLSFTKKNLDVWKKYIECMVRKYSIRKSADECKITIRTSFMWRHKILDALRLSDKTELSGIVEADETFFRVSYKGSRNIDRKSRRRGGEVHKRGLSTEQVCVVCSIERDSKESISKIGGLGKTSIKTISSVLNNKIKEKSVICTDKEKSYLKFAKSNNLEHIRLEEYKAKKGIYHINHINSYHTRLKKFIDKFNGVSTKHLNNYLIWNNIINENNSSNSESFMVDKVLSKGLQNIGCTLYRDVCSRQVMYEEAV